jgi:hypothetical protein
MSCGADTEASALITSLLTGVSVEIPNVDMDNILYKLPTTDIRIPIRKLTNADLTTGTVGGTGTFDVLMKSVASHLKDEYEKNRITGAEYTKTYAALVTAAMSSATQFLLTRDQAYWQSQTAQINAITASVQLELAKVEYASKNLEARTIEANYALTKIKLASESNAFCLSKYELENIKPAQLANLLAQVNMVKEQMEAQRAQTKDTRSDGTPVLGALGTQKSLYNQQITSYQRDAEVKTAKLFTDAWITQKTIDEGLVPPDNFTNTSINAILGKLKTNNGLS